MSRDPRAQRSKRGYPMTMTLVGVVLLVVMGYAAMLGYRFLMESDTLPFRHVTVVSKSHYLPIRYIKQAITNNVYGGFFSLDQRSLQRAIMSYPWVKSVGIRRLFPNTLYITVRQQQPVAYWGANGILNRDGDVFYPRVYNATLALPRLTADLSDSQALYAYYLSFKKLLMPLGLDIKQMAMSKRLALRMLLSNGVTVVTGHDQVMSRFKRFVALYPKIAVDHQRHMLRVDLRYPNGVAVQYR